MQTNRARRTRKLGSTAESKPSRLAKGKETSKAVPQFVVGVGASAGGLEALQSLLGSLGSLSNICLVVVQHLAPQHRSRLVEILSHSTRRPVKEVTHGARLQVGTVYVTPPNADVIYSGGKLCLVRPLAKIAPKPSIDRFFASIAGSLGPRAIGIILSGTGSDGSKGISEIKRKGGIVLVQSVNTAKYDGMPRSARQTGCVDMELPADEIGSQINLYNSHVSNPGFVSGRMREPKQDPYRTVLSILEMGTRVDFSQYKSNTIRRRIGRRIATTGSKDVNGYAEYLSNKPEEIRNLFQDILISVTSFFRDEHAYAALRKKIHDRVREKSSGSAFRIWVAGCATGQEVYSIAILVLEALEIENKKISVHLFATDIDEQAMSKARRAVYPLDAFEKIPTRLREKYFDTHPDGLKVKDFVRELVVFARHDITRDPPFLKLDLISCRNVLIYFNQKLQESVFKSFHFALDEGGILFLGKSEAVGSASEKFILADKNAKLFLRRERIGSVPRPYSANEARREKILQTQDRKPMVHVDVLESVVNGLAPNSVLVDSTACVLRMFGAASKFLSIPKSGLSVSLLKLLPAAVSSELAGLLRRGGRRTGAIVGLQKHNFIIDGTKKTVQLSVLAFVHKSKPEYLVTFIDAPPDSVDASIPNLISKMPADKRARAIEKELQSYRRKFQTILEEHETANEEMQALNEELQSANEELQSTNEELETTNEELQSANEELTTLNEEINVKSAEYLALNQRYLAVQNAIIYPLIMVDTQAKLVDFNPAARYLFRISDGDIGQHIRVLSPHFDFGTFLTLVQKCLEQQKDQQLQLKSGERDFEVKLQLFKAPDGKPGGVVISFVENTQIVRAFEQVNFHKNRLSAIMENTPAIVTMKDTMGMYTYANLRFYEVTKLSQANVLGKTDEELFGSEDGDSLRLDDFEVLKKRRSLVVEQKVQLGGEARHWLSSKFPLLDEKRNAHAVCSVSLDVTEKKLHEQQLAVFREVVSATSTGIVVFEKQGNSFRSFVVSDELAKGLGRKSDELLGLDLKALEDLFEMKGWNLDFKAIKEAMSSGKNISFTANLADKHGKEDWAEVRASTIRQVDSDSHFFSLMIFDINERTATQKLIEQQKDELSRFSKLAALGEVAAGLSHEINTPLNVITTRTDLMRRLAQRELLEKEKIETVSIEIDKMVGNISDVIQGLKSMSRMETQKMETEDLNSLVDEAVRICHFRLFAPGLRFRIDKLSDKLEIRCYPVQVIQIIVNLLNNAIDAVSELRDRWIEVRLRADNGNARLVVTDSGKGIDPSIAEKIMTPFFTTKKKGEGTGLGLSLSRSMARRMGGELSLEKGNQNTCFVLEIPLAEAAAK